MNNFTLTDSEKNILLHTARETISARLLGKTPEYEKETANLHTLCGAFVTLHKNGKLRGCIGQMIGYTPLFRTVREMAEASAFNDPRFPPVSPEEIDHIDIEISVLTPLQEIHDLSSIKVGEHGIYIEKGPYSGVLLPQVAGEYNWDRDTFLTHTCYKAGLQGECWKDPATKINIFSAIIFSESGEIG